MTKSEALKLLTSPGFPYETVSTQLNGQTKLGFSATPTSIRDVVVESRGFGDAAFLVYEEERYSFSETYERVSTLANYLVNDCNVQQGDRIAIAMRNYPEWVFSYLAAACVGAVSVALNSWWSGEELNYAIEETGAVVTFVDEECHSRIKSDAVKVDTLFVAAHAGKTGGEVTTFENIFSSGSPGTLPAVSPSLDDLATIVYTSGSTSRPKGVVSTNRAVLHALMAFELNFLAGLGLSEADYSSPSNAAGLMASLATLSPAPLFHVNGTLTALLPCLRGGRKLVLMRKWDPLRAIDLIDREAVNVFVSVPTITDDLAVAAIENSNPLESLLIVGGGGSARSAGQVGKLTQAFASAAPVNGWGMTETNALGCSVSGEEYLLRPSSSGQMHVGLEVKLNPAEEFSSVEEGVGELMIRGTSMFSEYWNDKSSTELAHEDGWFITGDLARIDDEGYVYIVGRSKNIVIRGGENIGVGEVQDALLGIEDILDAVVFGVPDERLGEELAASLQLAPASELSEDDIRQLLATLIAKHKVPRYISMYKQQLPRIASGKHDLRTIKDTLMSELGGA